MPEFLLVSFAVLIMVTCWPHSGAPVGSVSLAGAFFVAAPLGWVLAQTKLAFFGWALLAFAAWVLGRWLWDKWAAQ